MHARLWWAFFSLDHHPSPLSSFILVSSIPAISLLLCSLLCPLTADTHRTPCAGVSVCVCMSVYLCELLSRSYLLLSDESLFSSVSLRGSFFGEESRVLRVGSPVGVGAAPFRVFRELPALQTFWYY